MGPMLQVAKDVNKPIFLLAEDPTSSKAFIKCFVPSGKSVTASAWAAPVGEILGGKMGGKDDMVMGSAPDCAKFPEAKQIAEQFAKEHFK